MQKFYPVTPYLCIGGWTIGVPSNSQGKVRFFEVKGHRFEAKPRLSERQKEIRFFVKDVLGNAANKRGHWRNVSDEVSNYAEDLLDLIDAGEPINGTVINVNKALTDSPEISVKRW